MAKIGYARISTVDQNPELQIRALKALHCDRIFKDEVSAVGKDRPGFRKALSCLHEGDSLVVWKLDRAFRSTVDAVLTQKDLYERGVDLVIATLGNVSDTAEGRHFYRNMASTAEYERDINSERTKEGMAVAKLRGDHVGRPANVTVQELEAARKALDQGADIVELAQTMRMSVKVLQRRLRDYRTSAD